MSELRADATAECEVCAMPLIPLDEQAGTLLVECANRHTALVPIPTDPVLRRLVDNWLARRGAQLHEQRERWGTDDEHGTREGRA